MSSYSLFVLDDQGSRHPRQAVPTARRLEPPATLPTIAGGEEKKGGRRRRDDDDGVVIGAEIGDQIAVVIQGDGPNGIFIGTLAAVEEEFIRLALTAPVGPIPAGTVVTILTDQIAVFGRVPVTTTA